MERGVRTWMKPWNAEHAAGRINKPIRHNGQPYYGINILMLWSAAVENSYSAPIWMTYRQSIELGAHVRKGEKGELVVYASTITKTEHDDKTGEDSEQTIAFMKCYTVFNVEQIEELPAHYYQLAEPVLNTLERIDRAEHFFSKSGAEIHHRGNRAYYLVATDCIQLPPFEAFRDTESYYTTLAHEMTPWTCHPSRLDRDFGRKTFGDEDYAREELVAELGSAFLAACSLEGVLRAVEPTCVDISKNPAGVLLFSVRNLCDPERVGRSDVFAGLG
jgi:antirestriction protein ArdC